jgi:hypothetical protein
VESRARRLRHAAFSTTRQIAINVLQNCHFDLAKVLAVALSDFLRDSASGFI